MNLLIIVKKIGKKWSEVCKLLNTGRTENNVKNKYHSITKRKKNIIFS